jgi:diaminopimelate decarboxylase
VAEKPRAAHSALDSLRFEDDVLVWGGKKVTDLASRAGDSPFYVYDRTHIRDRVGALRAVLPEAIRIHYAMKANPMPPLVAYVADLVDGLDVASAGEIGIAVQTDTLPKDISFAGPGKRDSELEVAVTAGITINAESTGELRRLARIAENLGVTADVALRVNPMFELKTAGMKMGGHPSQFGIDSEAIPQAIREVRSLGLRLRGFHVFSGAQNLSTDAISESLEQTTALVVSLADAADQPIELVNVGGGLGIPYFPGDRPIELDALAGPYAKTAERLRKELGNVEIVTELGRYLVGEAGLYVCRVVDVKTSRGTAFAVCDGGLHHHLAASGNFGQVIRKNYPVTAVRRRSETMSVTVVGPLCTPLDILANRVELSALEPGDLVAVLQSGAYGRSASPLGFLSHPVCAELLV